MPPASILIIDNDPDESARAVVARTPRTSYFATGDNLGPAGALALGLGQLLEAASDDDLVVLIDDDDPPPSDDTFETLLEAMTSAGLAGLNCGGVGLTGARYRSTRGDLVRVPDDELVGLVPVDYLGGGQCPIYRLGAVRDSAGVDAGLFFGFDDTDLGLALRKSGWDLLVPGDMWRQMRTARGRQNLGSTPRSTVALTPWRQYYSSRNIVILARKHGTHQRGLESYVSRALSHARPSSALSALDYLGERRTPRHRRWSPGRVGPNC